MGKQIIGVNPFQFWHLTHTVHHPVGCSMERVKIAAIEAVFQFVDLKVIQPLEFHIGTREGFAELRLVICQQIEGGLLTLGIDDELGIVGTCHLRSVGIHETG